jgi:molybdopterin-containing oxidoreductase family iron-sulfur binding subunit
MSGSRKYWNSLEQYNNTPEFVERAQNEFQTPATTEEFLADEKLSETATSRRDFLKFVGFSVAAATAAACETPVVKSIPFVVRPEEIVPGIANYYASTYADGSDYCSILVKTREGRPILINGNKLSSVTSGSVSPRVNASILSLYDSGRLQGPTIGGELRAWSDIDATVIAALQDAKAKGSKVRILTNSIISPSTKAVFNKLAETYGGEGGADVKHVTYDVYSFAGMIKANEKSFGKAVIPNYHFENAKTVVGFGADFLTTWLNHIENQNQYTVRRNPDGAWMSKHYQFESTMTITGSNADVRGAILPSEQGLALIELYNLIAKKAGRAALSGKKFESDNNVHEKLKHAANDLWAAKGEALVVANSNDVDIQTLVNGINEMLGAYGSTIDLNTPVYLKQSSDVEFADLANEMNAGSVNVLLVYGVNPVYSAPAKLKFEAGLKKVKTSIAFDDRLTETASLCTINATDNHFLESWNDYNPKGNEYSIAQPTISALFDTRQAQESMLAWSGASVSYYDFLKQNWEANMFPMQSQYSSFEAFWNSTVHDGVFSYNGTEGDEEMMTEGLMASLSGAAANAVKHSKSSNWEVEFYLSNGIGEGNHANNPWLQELPDPVSKVTWDNFIAMNPTDMVDGSGNEIYNIELAEKLPATVAKITIGGKVLEMPVVAVPGQKKGAVSIALGYGRTKAGKVVAQGDSTNGEERTIGTNMFPLVEYGNNFSFGMNGVTIEPTEKEFAIASTQTHHTMMGRKIVNETSLKTYKENDKQVWNPDHILQDSYGQPKHISKLDLWSAHDIDLGHRWGMSIDLNACYGCGACVIACHAENNVPVVGKDEVRRTRTMSWLRIDRYFSSDMTKEKGAEEGLGAIDTYGKMEIPSAYPEVVYQPVMCQHCNHAPCETVCPVAATTHSNEGFNQMTYNRCIGTRYCANNCPYKVRRFNWFNYIGDAKFADVNPSQDDLGKMVLNPDVVVRSRGVMEKCSFCIQSTQAAKLKAKKAGRPLEESDIDCACANACSVGAIKFGDLNDPKMSVTKEAKHDRSYALLEEIGVKPNVYYLTKVRNVDEERVMEVHKKHASGHGHGDDHGHAEEGEHEEHTTHEEHAH